MADALKAWMEAGNYLPDVLRDFHDQKDVFKAMHDLQNPASPSDALAGHYSLSFVTGQCYVIDRFLWFMALRGYTLQRSRARLPFRDLQADVKAATEKRNAHDMALLEEHVSGVTTGEPPSLHQQIMNLRCTVPDTEADSKHHAIWASGYKLGHRDARHAAAELVGAGGVEGASK